MFKKKQGTLFWVTGLSGSGKTTISKKIENRINKLYGPTIAISGDDLREIFKFNKYSKKERLILAYKYCMFCKLVTSQGTNIIFSTIAMFEEVRKWNRKNINSYVEIYIKSSVDQLIKKKMKKTYHKKYKNIWGIHIKSELPKNPDILIDNNFKKSTTEMSNDLIKKIKKLKRN